MMDGLERHTAKATTKLRQFVGRGARESLSGGVTLNDGGC